MKEAEAPVIGLRRLLGALGLLNGFLLLFPEVVAGYHYDQRDEQQCRPQERQILELRLHQDVEYPVEDRCHDQQGECALEEQHPLLVQRADSQSDECGTGRMHLCRAESACKRPGHRHVVDVGGQK